MRGVQPLLTGRECVKMKRYVYPTVQRRASGWLLQSLALARQDSVRSLDDMTDSSAVGVSINLADPLEASITKKARPGVNTSAHLSTS